MIPTWPICLGRPTKVPKKGCCKCVGLGGRKLPGDLHLGPCLRSILRLYPQLESRMQQHRKNVHAVFRRHVFQTYVQEAEDIPSSIYKAS